MSLYPIRPPTTWLRLGNILKHGSTWISLHICPLSFPYSGQLSADYLPQGQCVLGQKAEVAYETSWLLCSKGRTLHIQENFLEGLKAKVLGAWTVSWSKKGWRQSFLHLRGERDAPGLEEGWEICVHPGQGAWIPLEPPLQGGSKTLKKWQKRQRRALQNIPV